jgi:hypothetical protein
MPGEDLSGLRQAYSSTDALDQGKCDPALHAVELLAHCGLAELQGLGGSRDGSMVGDRPDDSEVLGVDTSVRTRRLAHVSSISKWHGLHRTSAVDAQCRCGALWWHGHEDAPGRKVRIHVHLSIRIRYVAGGDGAPAPVRADLGTRLHRCVADDWFARN